MSHAGRSRATGMLLAIIALAVALSVLPLSSQSTGFSPLAAGLVEIPPPAVGSAEWKALASSFFQLSIDRAGTLVRKDEASKRPVTLDVGDGFLYGENYGEFESAGEGLRFIPEDPKKAPVTIAKKNVVALLRLGGDVYALSGVALAGYAKGEALKLAVKDGAWTVAKTIPLPEVPAVAIAVGDAVYIVTYDGLCSLKAGAVTVLLSGQYWAGLNPSYVGKVGDFLYIGMRGSLARYDLATGELRAYAAARR